MKIAIIGGGASGMSLAYLLRKKHDITIYEKNPFLGGNIRTINKNVDGQSIDSDTIIDNGVLEFEKHEFVNFHKLLHELKVPYTSPPATGSTGLFLGDGQYLLSHSNIQRNFPRTFDKIREYSKLLLRAGPGYLNFMLKSKDYLKYEHTPFESFASDSLFYKWWRLILMYSYSLDYHQTANMPTEFCVPVIKRFCNAGTQWTYITGGVYTYIDKIVKQFDGQIFTNINIESIQRTSEGVKIKTSDGTTNHFHKVVFATTPSQVLKLLSDPTDEEKKRFGNSETNTAKTVIHTDNSMYKPFKIKRYSEFDLFYREGQKHSGYNAYLNRLLSKEDLKTEYHMSFNLEDLIDSDSILNEQVHETPLYTVEALRYRDEVKSDNGSHHTFHVGAYLYDGLHEGAIESAMAVSKLLGGVILN